MQYLYQVYSLAKYPKEVIPSDFPPSHSYQSISHFFQVSQISSYAYWPLSKASLPLHNNQNLKVKWIFKDDKMKTLFPSLEK